MDEDTTPHSGTEGSQAAPEADGRLTLDASSRDALRSSIRALQRNNPDFADIFGDLTGRTAQRTWAPRVRQLEAELEVERNLRKKQELELLASTKKGSEEIDNRFASDPQFAKEFAELAHYKPPEKTSTQDPELIREEIQEAFADLFEWAEGNGLPKDAATVLQTKAASGAYDKPGETLADWRRAFSRLERDVTAALLKKPASKSEVSNPALTRGGPDLSSSSHSNGSTPMPKTAEEFNNLPTDVQRTLIKQSYDAVMKLK